ncbi:MAG TPA: flagellar assembly protein FliW [Candidatus Cloacimonadota bacterium]|jgi:flagellar assembly factor FliW|nr:flagellar assembly protein FliW [Candidatus Cloacimonadota bacterium]HPM00797.1 flagellar assembly protein FliW [Candidatus Cloacimonadota bacterium]
MKAYTTRFGEIEISEETIISFPNGILGFPDQTNYALINTDDNSPLKWLQSLEDPTLAFVVTNPNLFKPDYMVDAYRKDLADINVQDAEDVLVLVIVTVPKDPSKMTANLKGPILINTQNRLAKQLVIDNNDYEIKYRLLSDDEAMIAFG